MSLAGAPLPEPSTIKLDGPWKFAIDSQKNGEASGWAKPEFDDSAWAVEQVPGKRSDLGKMWYRRVVTIPASWSGQPLMIQLPAVDDCDRTFWNGRKIGALGKADFQNPRVYAIPADAIKWGEPNVVAIEVTNDYGDGGFGAGAANILKPGPFIPVKAADADSTPALLPLEVTKDLAAKIGKSWTLGWRDEGTSDTRPDLQVRAGPSAGSDALGFGVRFPNANGEFVNCTLPPSVIGSVWDSRHCDYIRFDCQTNDTEGEMRLYLNGGNYLWKKGTAGYGASFRVKPGGWTTVVLPYSEFVIQTPGSINFMPDANTVRGFSLGYRDHELQRPGEIRFANFAVGRFPNANKVNLPLDGIWRFSTDPENKGFTAGWQNPEFDDSAWLPMVAGISWQRQGQKYDGVAWYRQQLFVPAEWTGLPLRLRLGKVTDHFNHAEVFLNGKSLGRTTKADKKLDFKVPAEAWHAGALNTLSVRVEDNKSNTGGLLVGPFDVKPLPVWTELRETGSGAKSVLPASFDPGPLPGRKKYNFIFHIPKICISGQNLKIAYELGDCFSRVIARGETALKATDQPYMEAVVSLTSEESRRLYFSEGFDSHVQVLSAEGTVVFAGAERGMALSLASRDQYAAPNLPEQWEETPYGRLKLVDVVDAGVDAGSQEHPYKEGGVRAGWVGRRAYATWQEGIRVNEFQGRKYREATNNEWFAYRLGRGIIDPNKAYVVRIEYPEDKTRYCPINVDAGRNYQGLGFKTGVSTTDVFDNYPLRQKYDFYDLLVKPDQLTYGSGGSRTVPVDKGFWIFFFDTGRAYVPQYSAGSAVSQIRLYEISDLAAYNPKVRLPEGLPQRIFMADWEREPEAIAKDVVAHARFSGYNAIAPSILKWGSLGFWHVTGMNIRPVQGVREPLPDTDVSPYEIYLDATREAGMKIFPRLEYTGTEDIPKDQRAIGPEGGPAKPNRFATWCADLLRPMVAKEFSTITKQVIGDFVGKNPQIAGILFRIRSDRLPISYSRYDVEMFASETKTAIPPDLNDAALAKWASSGPASKAYEGWWQAKRRDFHRSILTDLKNYRPDLKMLYYNWDVDGWELGSYSKTPQDYTDFYNVDTSIDYYKRAEAFQAKFAPADYAAMVREGKPVDYKLHAELYSGMPDFGLLGAINFHYLADNSEYVNVFRTGDNLALSKMYNYEEKARSNVQGDNYESSEMATGGHDFAMAEQVLSVFHGDPFILTETTYTYGQGFLDMHRKFAQAFLALPASPGKVVENPSSSAEPDLRVRRYDTKNGVYLEVVHKGYDPAHYALSIPGSWTGKEVVADLVSGKNVPSKIESGCLVFELETAPVSLSSFLVK